MPPENYWSSSMNLVKLQDTKLIHRTENCKTLIKDTENETNRCKDIVFTDWKNQYC